MNRGIKSIILGVFFGAMFVLGILSNVGAQEECSVATLQGGYLVTGGAERTAYQHDDLTYPRRVVAVWNFDGEGTITGFTTQSLGGQINIDQPVNGTYKLDSDCTGTADFPEPAASWRLVFLRDLSEGAAIRTDTGHIATRSIKKR